MTQKVCLSTSSKDEAYTFAGALQELLDPPPEALSVFEAPKGGWSVEAYFQDVPEHSKIRDILETCTGQRLPALTIEDIPALNWVAVSQSSLPPVFAGSFVVYGSHDKERIPRGPRAILIEAGEAFGTAHHATTYSCLLAIDRLTRKYSFKNVLDLGCGSGILALAVSRRLPRARIIASDNDRTSVQVARENCRKNTFARQIDVLCAHGVQHPRLREENPFDLICANVLAGPLIALAPDLSRIQRTGGMLLLSGILVSQSDRVAATYRAHGYQLMEHVRTSGWSTFVLQLRT